MNRATTQTDLPKIIANIIKPIVIANLYNWKISKVDNTPLQTILTPIKTEAIKANIKKAAEALELAHLDADIEKWVLATFTDLLSSPCQSCASLKNFVPQKPMQTMSNVCNVKAHLANEFWNKHLHLKEFALFSIMDFGGIRRFSYNKERHISLGEQLKDPANPGLLLESDPLPSITKVFSFAYPDKCFIYDSRVSLALLAIIPRSNLTEHNYPLLKHRVYQPKASQVQTTETQQERKKDPRYKKILDFVGKEKYQKSFENPRDYESYCNLIIETAKHLDNCNPQMVEMALFLLGKGIRDCIYADTAN